MKFSYYLLKKLVPELKSRDEAIEKLTLYSFEVDDLGGDIFDVSISPNRFSDAASHFGLAREISATLKTKPRIPELKLPNIKTNDKKFKISVLDYSACPRYIGLCMELKKTGKTPEWIEKILFDCGMRPINPIVDVMNYAMLETGQPLHAFDYDKLFPEGNPEIIVRFANKGEKITTLDERDLELDEKILVIADKKRALAIAGIKGGKDAEVDENTKRIIIEAANFERGGIYRASQKLKLITDASARFSHDLDPILPEYGIARSAELLKDICGAEAIQLIDSYSQKSVKQDILFDTNKFRKFIGITLGDKEIKDCLNRLGFEIKENKQDKKWLVVPPEFRPDVISFQDVSEEIIRLYGLNSFLAEAPTIKLTPAKTEDHIILRDKISDILISAGFSRVRNYSFLSVDDLKKSSAFSKSPITIQNPISSMFEYLRPSLAPYLIKNIESNIRFFDDVRIFEIGKIFNNSNKEIIEKTTLGIILADKKKSIFFDMKGIVSSLFGKIGLINYSFREMSNNSVFSGWCDYLHQNHLLEILVDEKPIGFFGRVIGDFDNREVMFAEIDFDKLLVEIKEENEFKPIPKFPSISRDISVLVSQETKAGEMEKTIEKENKLIDNAELIDEYSDKTLNGKRSLTFRIIFQAEDRTLTDFEVNEILEKIISTLKQRFKVEER